jgi:hypothetical protein
MESPLKALLKSGKTIKLLGEKTKVSRLIENPVQFRIPAISVLQGNLIKRAERIKERNFKETFAEEILLIYLLTKNIAGSPQLEKMQVLDTALLCLSNVLGTSKNPQKHALLAEAAKTTFNQIVKENIVFLQDNRVADHMDIKTYSTLFPQDQPWLESLEMLYNA